MRRHIFIILSIMITAALFGRTAWAGTNGAKTVTYTDSNGQTVTMSCEFPCKLPVPEKTDAVTDKQTETDQTKAAVEISKLASALVNMGAIISPAAKNFASRKLKKHDPTPDPKFTENESIENRDVDKPQYVHELIDQGIFMTDEQEELFLTNETHKWSGSLSTSLHNLVRDHRKYVLHKKRLIDNTHYAEQTCTKARSTNGKKGRELMDSLNAQMGTVMPATEILTAVKLSATLAQRAFHNAKIRCGEDYDTAKKSQEKAEKFFAAYRDEIGKFRPALEKLNAAVAKHANLLQAQLTPKQSREPTNCTTPGGPCDPNLPSDIADLKSRIDKYSKIISNVNGAPSSIADLQSQLIVIENALPDLEDSLKPLKAKLAAVDNAYAEHDTLITSLAQTAVQAAQSKAALSAANGNSGPSSSLAQMCADPVQAQTATCKCLYNNTAKGCPGFIASASTNGALTKINNGGGVSQMAGAATTTKRATALSTKTGLGDISDDAKEALNLNQAPSNVDASTAGAAPAASVGGGGGSGGGAGPSPTGSPGTAPESGKIAESKSFGSSVMGAVGRLFGGGSGSTGAGTTKAKTSSTLTQSEYLDKAKRKIASENFKAEVSGASGVSNWDKVKNRYRSTQATLLEN